ncbi:ABC transporter ATP-binding protein [Parabacteroides sp. Marseille-P3160]|uniref:ABC transporter ATP-binding protein n=1 Tax=Parabacteroides sp. Marseille-P3160 TaxID=1917887 RepID=UPI0009BC37EF|nr:ABC transporter ATP-binding protein [Parabacteroides sp. Marseille-P3160]
MKLFWKYLKPHKGLIFFSLLLATIAQLLNLIDPIIFGKIIDDYATNVDNKTESELINGVLFWLAIAVAIALLSRVASVFQEFLTNKVVSKFGMQIFNDGIRQTLRLSFQEFEESRSGETLSILQKIKKDTERFVNSFINILFSSMVGIGFLVWYSITKSWLLIPVFLIGILLLGSLTGLLSKKIKTTQRSINKKTNEISGIITESLRNIELVKSLGLTFPEIRRMKAQTEGIYNLEMAKLKRVRMLSFFQSATLNILKQSILFILLWLIFRDILSTGELIAMQFISTSIFGPLQNLGTIIVQYREVEASIQIFKQLMQKPIEKRPEDAVEIDSLNAISFENVIFRHQKSSFNAIDGISFQAKIGETIAFVGPSGSGKSTLIKLLVGLYKPVGGDIFFNGVSFSQIRYNPLRRQIGFVTQDTQLFAGTIRDNLLFVKPDATDDEVLAALEKASAKQLTDRSPKGIYTVVGENGMKLSGGEKQRISIARALLRNPKLLIFDEATSALDSLTEETVTNTIKTVSKDRERISILIAHRLSTVMHADTIFVLEKGKIVEAGSHQTLLSQKGLYYAMWRQQIGERRKEEVL